MKKNRFRNYLGYEIIEKDSGDFRGHTFSIFLKIKFISQ